MPIRCTQNPTMGEEWRKGWHPERIDAAGSKDTVLVVGAGPTGLELTRALGQRGYEVALADAGTRVGGRLIHDAALPGLATWMRVADHRMLQIQKMTNVNLYLDSRLSASQVLEFGFNRVFIATGARWRKDGLPQHRTAMTALRTLRSPNCSAPTNVCRAVLLPSHRLIYRDHTTCLCAGGRFAQKEWSCPGHTIVQVSGSPIYVDRDQTGLLNWA